MGWFRRISTSRPVLRLLYYIWVAFPYPVRKPLTAAGLFWVLAMKKVVGVNRQNKPTPMKDLGNLSFWGVPEVDIDHYSLELTGEIDEPLRLSLAELRSMDSEERPVRMDCVGGFRNNSSMKGVRLSTLFEKARPTAAAESAVFHCADGFYTAHRLDDLADSDAFMAYEINGQQIDRFGYPLRLVAPETYGYKWAKWVVRIELVTGFPKGYWEQKGLPSRGRIGDLW